MHPVQKRIFKKMTPEQKLRISMQLYRTARELKAAGLRRQHPEWTPQQIDKKVREIFLYART
jgi:hypothetical protein